MTETKTDNEIIAEFMGILVFKDYAECQRYPIDELTEWVLVDQMKYRTSWDWLMPAYKKFKDCLSDYSKSMPHHSACMGDLIDVDIHCAIIDVDLPGAHAHLVNGIKWHNDQKK